MKPFFVVCAITLFACVPAQGRIGETLDQIKVRFGEPKANVGTIRIPGHDQYAFEKDGFGIQCVFSDGKVIMEVFHRLGPMISEQDVKDILKAEADNHSWRHDTKTGSTIRGDNKLEAYREPGHDDFLFIKDIAAVKEATREKKGKPAF